MPRLFLVAVQPDDHSYVIHNRQDEEGEHVHKQEIDENDEVDVVRHANAVVKPWAVVVHSLDTLIANIAMLRPRRLDNLTCWAQLDRVD